MSLSCRYWDRNVKESRN